MDFDAAYARSRLLVYRRCLRLTGRVEDAEDAAQEVWIHAWRAWERLSVQEAVQIDRVLMTTAKRVVIDRWRREVRAGVCLGPPGAWEPAADDVEAVACERAELSALDQAIGETRHGMVVVMAAHGYSEGAITRALRMKNGTVKSRLHRARAELRKRVA